MIPLRPICLLVATVLTGCSHALLSQPQLASRGIDGAESSTILQKGISPDVRYLSSGRYGLVGIQPLPEQIDPLLQIIDIRIAPSLNATVADALHFVLQRSGYSLCAATPEVQTLFSRPLPSVHYHLGPISLMDALDVLGGEAWQLQTDPVLRTVCFTQRQVVTNDPSLTAEGQP